MSYHKTITVLGGDARQVAVAQYFAEGGFSVRAWGLPQTELWPSVTAAAHWQEAVGEADVVVLPLPASPDSKYLNVPRLGTEAQKPPRISQIAHELPTSALLAGGRFSPAIKEMLREGGVHFFDYFERYMHTVEDLCGSQSFIKHRILPDQHIIGIITGKIAE